MPLRLPFARWVDRALTVAAVGVVATVGFRYLGPRPGDALGALSGVPVAPRGPVRLIELGATYCPSCVAMAPTMALLRRAYAGRAEVTVLDIDRPEHRSAVEPLARVAQLRYTPTFLVLGSDGVARAKFVGPASYVALAAAVDQALRVSHP